MTLATMLYQVLCYTKYYTIQATMLYLALLFSQSLELFRIAPLRLVLNTIFKL